MAFSLGISRRKAKRILITILLVVLFLAITVGVAGVVFLDRNAWIASRRLSAALQGARSVTLIEFTHGTSIARVTATPDEISRLRSAASVWVWPFLPKAYLCFEPHHRVEIVRADGSDLRFEVCFLCENFAFNDQPPSPIIDLPPSWRKSLALFFTSLGMAPKTLEEYAALEKQKGSVPSIDNPPTEPASSPKAAITPERLVNESSAAALH